MATRNSNRRLNKLGASEVQHAKARDKIYKLSDGGGLQLLIKPVKNAEGFIVGERKYWQLRYRFAGKENTASLGTFPDMTLAEARVARDNTRKMVSDKINPNRQKRIEADALGNTFKSVSQQWFKLKSTGWKSDKHRVQVWTSLETHVFPTIGNVPVNQITEEDCDRIIECMFDAGIYETASRVLQRMVSIFGYALRRRKLIKTNPAKGADEYLSVPESAKNNHHPALAEKDMPRFLADYAKRGVSPQTRIALHLLMLTAVRTSELIEATWDEIDFDKKAWLIPEHRMKSSRDHVVPLSMQAISAFKEAKQHCGNSNLVFPGISNKKPISNNTVLFSIYKTVDSSQPDNRTYKGRMTGHGFRAVFSTHLHALKTKPKDGSEGVRVFGEDSIEFQLAHVSGNQTKKAYDRNCYLSERSRVMDYWGSVCESWQGGNVIPLHKTA